MTQNDCITLHNEYIRSMMYYRIMCYKQPLNY